MKSIRIRTTSDRDRYPIRVGSDLDTVPRVSILKIVNDRGVFAINKHRARNRTSVQITNDREINGQKFRSPVITIRIRVNVFHCQQCETCEKLSPGRGKRK